MYVDMIEVVVIHVVNLYGEHCLCVGARVGVCGSRTLRLRGLRRVGRVVRGVAVHGRAALPRAAAAELLRRVGRACNSALAVPPHSLQGHAVEYRGYILSGLGQSKK